MTGATSIVPCGMVAASTASRLSKILNEPSESVDAQIIASRNDGGGGMVVVGGGRGQHASIRSDA